MMTDEEKAARVRLGAWLVAEPGRTWDVRDFGTSFRVTLVLDYGNVPDAPGEGEIDGTGPTLADAILAALENAANPRNDEPNDHDDVTREELDRDEWTR